jgi:NAD(P)-dependent dehydrogenase (short-subunit alcohol dehydrogenase family)
MKERFKTVIPVGRMEKPEEIASAAVLLASDESSYKRRSDWMSSSKSQSSKDFFCDV